MNFGPPLEWQKGHAQAEMPVESKFAIIDVMSGLLLSMVWESPNTLMPARPKLDVFQKLTGCLVFGVSES